VYHRYHQYQKGGEDLIANRRIRLDLDAETYELHSYFARLRGLSTGRHIARVLTSYATSAEDEFPALRAHMLAWRAAQGAECILDAASAKLVVGDMVELPF
jgi:hypothetical protein